MDFNTFHATHQKNHKPDGVRYGQWLMDELWRTNSSIRIGIDADCFFNDKLIPKFWESVASQWT